MILWRRVAPAAALRNCVISCLPHLLHWLALNSRSTPFNHILLESILGPTNHTTATPHSILLRQARTNVIKSSNSSSNVLIFKISTNPVGNVVSVFLLLPCTTNYHRLPRRKCYSCDAQICLMSMRKRASNNLLVTCATCSARLPLAYPNIGA